MSVEPGDTCLHRWSAGVCLDCLAEQGIEPPSNSDRWVDPVQVVEMWQATCDACGWHTQPASPHSAVREWARLHRVTCPRKAPTDVK